MAFLEAGVLPGVVMASVANPLMALPAPAVTGCSCAAMMAAAVSAGSQAWPELLSRPARLAGNSAGQDSAPCPDYRQHADLI